MVTLKFKNAVLSLALASFLVGWNEPAEARDAPISAESDDDRETHEETTFTVVTYNVENLFDVDSVALFDDYKQLEGDPKAYNRAKFLTKLEMVAKVLSPFNQGTGPEIILFQELEADATPETTVADYGTFIERYSELTLETMLGAGWDEAYSGFPASAWLLKALTDAGLRPYEVVSVPSPGFETGIAHTNAVFSAFPIEKYSTHELSEARAIIEAEINVNGNPLIVYVNHWKSGASNPKREPIRVGNAAVLRELLDKRLEAAPDADIIVAGDLNAHYNHSILFPEITTGINDILGSSGDEQFADNDLYNLWFELPPEERYSEVWRGRRGSLMHMLLTPGLYDDSGISYVDGSFDKHVLPGLNADQIGRPLKWHSNASSGGGASDHFPVYAVFTTKPFKQVNDLSRGDDAPDYEMPLNVAGFEGELVLQDGVQLNPLDDEALAPLVGKLYRVDATIKSIRPLRLQVSDRLWPAYYADRSVIEEDGLPRYLKTDEGRVRLIVRPGFYRGNSQLVIEAIEGAW